jgi:hypothetical protein
MDSLTSLAGARIVIGAIALLFPNLAARLFLLNVRNNPQLPYMARLFGSREIALGAMTLAAPEKSRTQMVALGMAVDGADAFAGASAMRTGYVSKPAGVMLTGAALGAVGAAAAILAGRR